MIKILIADDHQMFIDGLKSILSQQKQCEIIAEANNGLEVLEQLNSHTIDVVLLDVNMPEMDGIAATKKIRELHPEVKVLMLTMFNTRDYIEKLLKAGAHGYILKNTGKEELIEAIEKVHSGESFFSEEVKLKIMEGLQQKKKLEQDMFQIELTEREQQVLTLIVKEYTTNEIAEELFISPHTVETYRKNLTSKLPVKNIAGLVRYAIQMGLVD
jgi:DNA-binding NarL/FixJ family response regulator